MNELKKDLISELPEEELRRVEIMRKNYYTSDKGNYWARNAEVLAYWAEAKKNLYSWFGNKFVISRDIHITQDPEELGEKIQLSQEYRQFEYELSQNLRQIFIGDTDWMRDNKILSLIYDRKGLGSNRYVGDKSFDMVFASGGKPFRVNPGMKLMKVLSTITKHTNIDQNIFEDFRIKCSQVTNERTINRTLYISLLPSDFMTASVNDCDWRSCMTWDGGEYRQGTVEMMNSPMVVCAYTTSSNPMTIGSEEFNNKNWREFFIVDPIAIVGIKGYPYWNRSIEAEALLLLADTIEENTSYNFNKTSIRINARDSFEVVNPEYNDVHWFEFYTNKMYNDMYSEHYALVNPAVLSTLPNRCVFEYSGPSQCMGCGEATDSIGENELLCDECLNIKYCSECGCRIDPDYDNYTETVDGDIYCDYCNDDLPTCEICGATYSHNSSLINDYLVKDGEDGDYYYRTYLDEECILNLSRYFKIEDNVITIPRDEFKNMSYHEIREIYPYDIAGWLSRII